MASIADCIGKFLASTPKTDEARQFVLDELRVDGMTEIQARTKITDMLDGVRGDVEELRSLLAAKGMDVAVKESAFEVPVANGDQAPTATTTPTAEVKSRGAKAEDTAQPLSSVTRQGAVPSPSALFDIAKKAFIGKAPVDPENPMSLKGQKNRRASVLQPGHMLRKMFGADAIKAVKRLPTFARLEIAHEQAKMAANITKFVRQYEAVLDGLPANNTALTRTEFDHIVRQSFGSDTMVRPGDFDPTEAVKAQIKAENARIDADVIQEKRSVRKELQRQQADRIKIRKQEAYDEIHKEHPGIDPGLLRERILRRREKYTQEVTREFNAKHNEAMRAIESRANERRLEAIAAGREYIKKRTEMEVNVQAETKAEEQHARMMGKMDTEALIIHARATMETVIAMAKAEYERITRPDEVTAIAEARRRAFDEVNAENPNVKTYAKGVKRGSEYGKAKAKITKEEREATQRDLAAANKALDASVKLVKEAFAEAEKARGAEQARLALEAARMAQLAEVEYARSKLRIIDPVLADKVIALSNARDRIGHALRDPERKWMSDSMRKTVEANEGLWTHRSYKQFDPDARWRETADKRPENQEAVRQYLRDKMSATRILDAEGHLGRKAVAIWKWAETHGRVGEIDGMSPRTIRNQVKDGTLTKEQGRAELQRTMDAAEAAFRVAPQPSEQVVQGHLNSIQAYGSEVAGHGEARAAGPGDMGMWKTRGDIHPSIRAMWGQHTNPVDVIAKTLMPLVRQDVVSGLLRDLAMEYGPQRDADGNIVKQGSLFTTEQTGEITARSPDKGALRDLFGHPDIIAALKESADGSNKDLASLVMSTTQAVNGIWQFNKAVLGHTQYPRNFLGNSALVVRASGMSGVKKWGKGQVDAIKHLFSDPNTWPEDMQRMAKDGILSSDASVDALSGFLKELKADDFDPQNAMIDMLRKKGMATVKNISAVYQSLDAGAKIAVWRTWYERATAAGMNKEAAMKWATHITIETMPNANFMSKIGQAFSKMPFVGVFTGFATEKYRTLGGTIRLVREMMNPDHPLHKHRHDLATGLIYSYTLSRMSSHALTALTMGPKYALQQASRPVLQWFGYENEDEVGDLDWLRKPWNGVMAVVSRKYDPDRGYNLITVGDTAAFMPYSPEESLLYDAASLLGGKTDRLAQSVGNVLSPFGMSPAASFFSAMANNEDEVGRKIWVSEWSDAKGAAANIGAIARYAAQWAQPSEAQQAQNLYGIISGEADRRMDRVGSGKTYSDFGMSFMGVTTNTIDPYQRGLYVLAKRVGDISANLRNAQGKTEWDRASAERARTKFMDNLMKVMNDIRRAGSSSKNPVSREQFAEIMQGIITRAGTGAGNERGLLSPMEKKFFLAAVDAYAKDGDTSRADAIWRGEEEDTPPETKAQAKARERSRVANESLADIPAEIAIVAKQRSGGVKDDALIPTLMRTIRKGPMHRQYDIDVARAAIRIRFRGNPEKSGAMLADFEKALRSGE